MGEAIPLLIILGLGALAVLVVVGRYGKRVDKRLAPAIFAALAAAAALASAFRGAWIAALALIVVALWIARPARGVRHPVGPSGAMTDRDARAMLGVGEAASSDEIEAAWRRLMLRAHPDRGGSPGLAAQLNAAREQLIKKS